MKKVTVKALTLISTMMFLVACTDKNKKESVIDKQQPTEKNTKGIPNKLLQTACLEGVTYYYNKGKSITMDLTPLTVLSVKYDSKTLKPERCGQQATDTKDDEPSEISKGQKLKLDFIEKITKEDPQPVEKAVISIKPKSESVPDKEEKEKVYRAWAKDVIQVIKTNWSRPSKSKGSKGRVEFIVNQRGLLEEEIKVGYCDGSPKFCSSIEKAVIHAQPLPIPPKKYSFSKNERTIGFTFRVN